MSLERAPLEHADTANQHDWSAPLAMFIAWLVRIFAQITKLKSVRRTTTFKPDWRDHWQNLRQLEWVRDQILAACAARLLAGETLNAESDFTPSTSPPAGYGDPCPRTPFDMNRRFLAIARFNADPESAILEHVRRIAKRAGIDLSGCPLRHATTSRATSPGSAEGGNAHRSLSSLAVRRWRQRVALTIAASSRRDGGGSHSSRGPPLNLKLRPPLTAHLARPAREAAPVRALTFRAISTTYPSTLELTHMKLSKPA